MSPETNAIVKYGGGGFILGAIFAVLFAVRFGYLYTHDDTQRIAHTQVVEGETEVCYTQFRKDPRYAENLKTLKGLETVKRDEFIQKGGWDKMPGQEQGDTGVSSACAERLAGLPTS